MKMLMTMIAGGVFAATGAMAQEANADIDTDGDGVYSMEELMVIFPTMTSETFAAVDANADGVIDPAEMAAGEEAGLVPATEG